MKWAKKHLNWTWIIAVFSYFASWYVVDDEPLFPVFPVLVGGIWLGITVWVLSRKGQDVRWTIFPISAILLTNKRVKKPQGKRWVTFKW